MEITNIDNQIFEILKTQPKLKYHKDKNILAGFLILYDSDLSPLDKYNIEIDITPFPKLFPIVKELDERIPRKADRHVDENGVCCLTTRPLEKILLKKFIKTLPEFINQIAIKFFLNNTYYEYTGKYKNGEYAHGIFGVIESYQDIMQLKDLKFLLFILNARIDEKKFERNSKCFCYSGKKFKNCHIRQYEELYIIDKEIIIADLINIYKMIDNFQNK